MIAKKSQWKSKKLTDFFKKKVREKLPWNDLNRKTHYLKCLVLIWMPAEVLDHFYVGKHKPTTTEVRSSPLLDKVSLGNFSGHHQPKT